MKTFVQTGCRQGELPAGAFALGGQDAPPVFQVEIERFSLEGTGTAQVAC
jgi:hypothetical protein